MIPSAVPQVVLVAGGAGTRLTTIEPDLPKCLAPVHRRPFLGYVLDLLVRQGVTRVHLCLGVGADHVLRFLGTGAPPSLEITTSVERAPLGTAGCLRNALPHLDNAFVVLLGDTYTAVDLEDVVHRFTATGAEAGMAVLRGGDQRVPSNVEVRGGLVVAYGKGGKSHVLEHIDYGISIMRRTTLERLPPADPVDLAVLYESLIRDGELAAIEVEQPFHEIGTPAALEDFRALVAHGALPDVLWQAASPCPDESPAKDAAPKHRVATRDVFGSPWMRVREDEVRLGDGRIESFGVVSRSDFVVAACDAGAGSAEYLMVEQFRYASGRWGLEFPQGAIDPGESLAEAAVRELREETGWEADDPIVVGERLHEAGDWATQSFAVVRVTARRFVGQSLDAGETGLRVRTAPAASIDSLVASGAIHDAATLAALYLVDRAQGLEP